MELKPNALHSEPLGVQPDPRRLTIEEAVMHQIDRIGYLRSVGEPWAEPVFHLRDLVVGLEDDEFWSGIPRTVKKDSLTPELRQEYSDHGWDSIPVRLKQYRRVVEGRSLVEEIPDPTALELSRMLQIILALLARRGMTWRQYIRDEIPPNFEGDDEE